MKKYHVIFPNPNGEGNRIYGLVRTEEEAKKYPQFRWVALEEL